LEDPEDLTKRKLISEFDDAAKDHGMQLSICAQNKYVIEGTRAARCVDAIRLSRIAGHTIRAKIKGRRADCGVINARILVNMTLARTDAFTAMQYKIELLQRNDIKIMILLANSYSTVVQSMINLNKSHYARNKMIHLEKYSSFYFICRSSDFVHNGAPKFSGSSNTDS
jgi:hypothetical protein